MPVEDPGLPPKRSKKEGQQESKEQHKQGVLEEHRLGKSPPQGSRGYGPTCHSKRGQTADSMRGMGFGLGNDRL